MSRVGEKPIIVPGDVEVKIVGNEVKLKGPKGELEVILPKEIKAKLQDSKLSIERKHDRDAVKALHGTYRAHLNNAVKGVMEGWKKTLELVGTGYRAQTTGKKLTVTVGFSHPVEIDAPEGISFSVEKNDINVEGIDRQLVGEVAAKIRLIRPPEPYKGKGIKYKDEIVRRKPGKAAKAAGAAGGVA